MNGRRPLHETPRRRKKRKSSVAIPIKPVQSIHNGTVQHRKSAQERMPSRMLLSAGPRAMNELLEINDARNEDNKLGGPVDGRRVECAGREGGEAGWP